VHSGNSVSKDSKTPACKRWIVSIVVGAGLFLVRVRYVTTRKHRRKGWHWQDNLLWAPSFSLVVIGVAWAVSGSMLSALAMARVISELARFYFNGAVAQFHNERRAFKI
jgi:hypothetical protein